MTRCAIYARVSTTKQADQNISIPDQLRRCREFAQARGMEIAAEFVDLGASARDDRRPQFQNMIESAHAKPKPFDIILIHSFSRFFRNEVEFEVYRRDLEKRGVAVVSITQEMSEGTGGEITRRIIALMDEMRSKEDAKHVKRGMQENARQGFWNGAPAPFGYKIIAAEMRGDRPKKKLTIDPPSAEVVKSIYDLFLNGDGKNGPLGVRAIVNWLNARGYNMKRGGSFYVSGVHAILTNETYAGTAWFNRKNASTGQMRPRSEWIELEVPAIVSKESFQRVQMILRERRPKNTPLRTTSNDVLLSGIAVCEGCGKNLKIATGKGGAYRYYKCSGKCLKGVCEGGVAVSIREEKLNNLSLDALTDRLLTPERTIAIVDAVIKRRRQSSADASRSLNQLHGQLRRTNSRIRNLYDALADGVTGDSKMFRESLSREEAEQESLLRLLEIKKGRNKFGLKALYGPVPDLFRVLDWIFSDQGEPSWHNDTAKISNVRRFALL